MPYAIVYRGYLRKLVIVKGLKFLLHNSNIHSYVIKKHFLPHASQTVYENVSCSPIGTAGFMEIVACDVRFL
jgi:hypothetical protein